MTENQNRPPEGSIIEEEWIRRSFVYENGKVVKKEWKLNRYIHAKDECGLPVLDHHK